MLLFADMIGARTGIKLLKRLGIALIFAPEPFTTLFGVAFVLAARYLSRRHESSVNMRVHEMVEYYLPHTNCFSNDSETNALSLVKRYALSEERAILGQITGSRSFKANIASSALQNWQDMRSRTVHHTNDVQSISQHSQGGDSCFKTFSRAEKVVHHTINREWLSQRYECAGSTVAHSSRVCTPGAQEKATHHSINMELLAQRYRTTDAKQTKVKYHTINMALLQQRYGAAMYKMALQAR